jgi:hypothetical protein
VGRTERDNVAVLQGLRGHSSPEITTACPNSSPPFPFLSMALVKSGGDVKTRNSDCLCRMDRYHAAAALDVHRNVRELAPLVSCCVILPRRAEACGAIEHDWDREIQGVQCREGLCHRPLAPACPAESSPGCQIQSRCCPTCQCICCGGDQPGQTGRFHNMDCILCFPRSHQLSVPPPIM